MNPTYLLELCQQEWHNLCNVHQVRYLPANGCCDNPRERQQNKKEYKYNLGDKPTQELGQGETGRNPIRTWKAARYGHHPLCPAVRRLCVLHLLSVGEKVKQISQTVFVSPTSETNDAKESLMYGYSSVD